MCTQNKLLLCNEVRAYSSIRDRQIAQEELICRGVRSEPIKCKTLRNYLGRNFEVTFASDPTNKYPLDCIHNKKDFVDAIYDFMNSDVRSS